MESKKLIPERGKSVFQEMQTNRLPIERFTVPPTLENRSLQLSNRQRHELNTFRGLNLNPVGENPHLFVTSVFV